MSAHIVVVGSLNADFVFTAQRFPAPGETVVGTDFALSCDSLGEAMEVVDDVAPKIIWRETTPGFWVARSI